MTQLRAIELSPTLQVLSWLLQRDIVVIPKSANEKRMLENLSVWLGFSQDAASRLFSKPHRRVHGLIRSKGTLSAEDMAKISALDRGHMWPLYVMRS